MNPLARPAPSLPHPTHASVPPSAARLATGLGSLDCIRFSGTPPERHEVVNLPDGLAFVRLPRLKSTDWACDGADSHRLILMMEPLAHLARPPCDEVAARRLLDRSFVVLPAGCPSQWVVGRGSFPQTLQLHFTPQFRSDPHGRAVPPRPVANLRDPILDRIMQLAEHELDNAHSLRLLALQGYGLAAVARLRFLTYGSEISIVSALGPVRLRRVSDYVEAHLDREITLDAMASVLGYSTSHFTRAFRLETGRTPYAWILSRRIERAKTLIRAGDLSLAEVALKCGFSSQSHMTETFRRLAGMPPGQWRTRERAGRNSD